VEENEIGQRVLGLAIKVHKALGPGLLESAYETCLAYELAEAELSFERQLVLPLHYAGIVIEQGYRLDLLVMRKVVLEIKKQTGRRPPGPTSQLPQARRLPARLSPKFQRIGNARRHNPHGERTLGAGLLRPQRLLRDLCG
jgi:GxxExxY protein